KSDRVEIAERGVVESRAQLAWIVVSLAPGAAIPGLRVTLDGAAIDPASLGSMIAVDSGHHTIAAEAPGRRRFEATVESGGAGDRRTVEVPAIAPEPPGSSAAAGSATPPGASASTSAGASASPTA